MRTAFIVVAAAVALFGASYEANVDRLDAAREHAMQVCVRAQHDHHVVVSTWNLQKCVDWNTINDEDDDQ